MQTTETLSTDQKNQEIIQINKIIKNMETTKSILIKQIENIEDDIEKLSTIVENRQIELLKQFFPID